MGKIKSWHDATDSQGQSGRQSAEVDIVVVHRSDGSGTTNIFTTYLAAVSPEWEKKVGKGLSVKWPVGLGGKGSEGVTGMVKQSPGAIGYVELSYAMRKQTTHGARSATRPGQYVTPSAESTSAAIDAFASELQKDVRDPIVNPPASAKDAYPVSGLTFLLIPKTPKSASKGSRCQAASSNTSSPAGSPWPTSCITRSFPIRCSRSTSTCCDQVQGSNPAGGQPGSK